MAGGFFGGGTGSTLPMPCCEDDDELNIRWIADGILFFFKVKIIFSQHLNLEQYHGDNLE